jgi:hypothetical protein
MCLEFINQCSLTSSLAHFKNDIETLQRIIDRSEMT